MADEVLLDEFLGLPPRRDPKLCWCCDQAGVPGIGSQFRCPECDVTWLPYAAPPPR